MKNVTIYTDGACSGNPGIGGWGAILMYNGHEKELSGYNKDTTNNRMEMFAVIQGLSALKEPCDVQIYSDSAYVCNAFSEGWVNQWEKNNWKTVNKTPVKNDDLWKHLLLLIAKHKVEFIKVKGHADNQFNNRCDKLATDAIKRVKMNMDLQ
ncbi:MAG: ribonuclease HI [Clostridia bacterium]|nr:ribonuclease HI [Clostridia bacterium]